MSDGFKKGDSVRLSENAHRALARRLYYWKTGAERKAPRRGSEFGLVARDQVDPEKVMILRNGNRVPRPFPARWWEKVTAKSSSLPV